MLRRSLSAFGRLAAMVLFGAVTFLMFPLALVYASVIALALVSLVGLVGGPICLLMKDYRTGLMLLGAGACAWTINMFVMDRAFGTRSGRRSISVPASLRIDFDG